MPDVDPSLRSEGSPPPTPSAAGFLDLTVRPFAADLCEPVRGARVLEVGCGDGRLARSLRSRGAHSVVGVDRSPTLIAAARRQEAADPRGIEFRVLDPHLLEPSLDGGFDVAVAALAFDASSFEELVLAVGQMGRVLRTGGRLVLCVLHPAFPFVEHADAPLDVSIDDAGWFSGRGRPFRGTVRGRDGHQQPIVYVHKGLEEYFEVLRQAGFRDLPEVVEQRIGDDHLALDPGFFRSLCDRPLFLGIRVRKTGQWT